MPDYKYDVFISYRRKENCRDWVQNTFSPLFKDFLEEAVGGRRVNLFIDEQEIASGANWENRIKKSLAISRCLMPILMPSYFHSQWCTKELAVIHYRQKYLGLTSIEQPNGLIIPIQVNDGDYFPAEVKKLQLNPFHEYFIFGKAFRDSPDYLEFQKKVKSLAEEVAKIIQSVPDCEDCWMTDDFLEISNQEFYLTDLPQMKCPEL